MLWEISKNVNMPFVASTKKPTPCCAPVLHARFGEEDANALAAAFKASQQRTLRRRGESRGLIV